MTATNGSSTSSATLSVSAGALNTIILSPASATIQAGTSQSFTVSGFDQFNNPLGDVTSSTSFSIRPDGTCSGATCTATVAGAHTVTGSLEGRTATASLLVVSSTATGFRVTAPASITAGTVFPVTVTAVDAAGNTVLSYGGPVILSVSSMRAGESIVPAGSSAGMFRYTVVLTLAGTRTLRATGPDRTEDSTPGSPLDLAGTSTIRPVETDDDISGSALISVIPGGPASLQIAAPVSVVAGSAFTVRLTVVDTFGNTATSYSGTLTITSSDPAAVLPSPAPTNSGIQSASITLKTPGTQTVSAADLSVPGLSATITITVNPATR